MRILQLVTLVSDEGAYGGPTTVALEQSAELARRGHTVFLVGTSQMSGGEEAIGQNSLRRILFRNFRLIPKAGFAGLSSPAMLLWLIRNVRKFDAIHIHLARDFVTLPAAILALLMRRPLFVQTHGMIDPSSKALAWPLDFFATRPVLRRCNGIFYLTEQERVDLVTVGAHSTLLVQLRNGIRPSEPSRVHRPRENASQRVEVLYLARLHPRKRSVLFARVAKKLLDDGLHAQFSLVGPDEGEGDEVTKIADNVPFLNYEGPIRPELVTDRLSRADIYVLPSVNEPYPMTVLEAMSAGLPVVITDTCGLADEVRRASCGIVIGDDAESLESAIQFLLTNPSNAAEMGQRGRQHIETCLGMDAVGDALEQAYRK